VVVTTLVGPTLSPDNFYIDSDNAIGSFDYQIERMFEDKYYIYEEPETQLPEMSVKVKEAIGPNNPYYSYTDVAIKLVYSY
jgi:hypothetical protein